MTLQGLCGILCIEGQVNDRNFHDGGTDKMEEVKVGQNISAIERFDIESEDTGEVLFVEEGDQAYVDSRGVVHYLTGEASGKSQIVFEGEQVVGYDHVNIAEMIGEQLDEDFSLEGVLKDVGVDYEDAIITIVKRLKDIL